MVGTPASQQRDQGASPRTIDKFRPAREILEEHHANELFFAVVGHVGSGTSIVAEQLKDLLEEGSDEYPAHQVEIVKASDVIKEWAEKRNEPYPSGPSDDLSDVERMQDLGDMMREGSGDHATVFRGIVSHVRNVRAKATGSSIELGEPVLPDGHPRAYIFDSVRHPAEVLLLRNLYGQNFALIGVVCDEEKRMDRITQKYRNAGKADARKFMERDANDPDLESGQHVADAFYEADYFVDNSEDKLLKDQKPNPFWLIGDELGRLVRIIRRDGIERPKPDETAMHHANSARLRSACLSRQVGAAIVDDSGNLLAVGTNEVPKAGGGVYGEDFGDPATVSITPPKDSRCAYDQKKCSNTFEQNLIINDLIRSLDENGFLTDEDRGALANKLRKSPIGALLEFSRAVHAEMDALLSVARSGGNINGARIFVTTFPCHYCARHIVTSGVDEVQYIEPYPKSKALALHSDSITTDVKEWIRPSSSTRDPSKDDPKVLFRPFVGVAPRLYRRAFIKDRSLKDKSTGDMAVGQPRWGGQWNLKRIGYTEMEAKISLDN